MKAKVLISGPPRCGKSTLISNLINYYNLKGYKVHGFITPEVRVKNQRIGFDCTEISSGVNFKLARSGNYHTTHRLGKYHIFLDDFERLIEHFARLSLENVDIIIIDEIGKMELFSAKFHKFIYKVFQSDVNIIATIGQKIQDPIKNHLLNLPYVKLFYLKSGNKEILFDQLIKIIS